MRREDITDGEKRSGNRCRSGLTCTRGTGECRKLGHAVIGAKSLVALMIVASVAMRDPSRTNWPNGAAELNEGDWRKGVRIGGSDRSRPILGGRSQQ